MKKTSLKVMVKQALTIALSLVVVMIGFALIPSAPAIGAALLVGGFLVVFYLQFYVFFVKWERYRFESLLIRWPDKRREYIILARDTEDPDNEILITEDDALYFSSITPSTWMQAPLYWYMWKGITDTRDEYYVVIGTPTAPQNLGDYTKVTIQFRGWFTRVWVRDIELDACTAIDVTEGVEELKPTLIRRSLTFYELDEYHVPVCLVSGSDWHSQLRLAVALGVLPEGARAAETAVLGIDADRSLTRLREIVSATSNVLVNLWSEEARRWQETANELQNIAARRSPIEIATRGFSVTELQPAQPAPPKSRLRIVLIALGVAAAVVIALVFLLPYRGVI